MTKLEKIQSNEAKVLAARPVIQISSKTWKMGDWIIERELGMASNKPIYTAATGSGTHVRIHVSHDLGYLIDLLK